MLGPAFLCALLLLIAFIPILSLQRVEGCIFKPLGITLVSALLGGQLGALIFIPLMASFTPVFDRHGEGRVDRFFKDILTFCEKLARQIFAIKNAVVKCGGVLLLLILVFSWGLGREFLPNLNEGDFIFGPQRRRRFRVKRQWNWLPIFAID